MVDRKPGNNDADLFKPTSEGAEQRYQHRWYNPHFQVTLINQDTGKPYDPLDINRDVMSINVKKSLSDPAGMWAITLVPRPYGGTRQSRSVTWAEIARPMDYIEIALGTSSGTPPTTVMRGFVDNARYVDGLDGSGNPERRVLISGRDFGKLWLNFKIFYLAELSQYTGGAAGILAQFYDFPYKFWTPNEFLNEVADRLLLKYLKKLQASNPAIPTPRINPSIPDLYQVNPISTDIQGFQGAIYNLLSQFVSQPFTELFWRDTPSQPELIWRWSPLLKRGNVLPLPDHAVYPPVHALHAWETTNLDMGRSDNGVLNYLWAPPTVFASTGSQLMKVVAPGYIDQGSIDRNGFRPYEPPFNLYKLSTGDPAHEQKLSEDIWKVQVTRNVAWLADVMLPNSKFFEGSLRAHLRPDLLVGDYLDLAEFGQRAYIEGVEHNFVVAATPSFSTDLVLSRGQAIDAPVVTTPGSYKYDPAYPNEVPGISVHSAAPTRETATTADQNPNTIGNGGTGTTTPAEPTDKNTDPTPTVPFSPDGYSVASFAKKLVGAPYEHSDSYLQDDVAVIFAKGIDCSRLTAWCYRRGKGKTIVAYAQTQYDTMSRVAADDLHIGDVLFYKNTYPSQDYVTHCALYIGDNQMISADDYGVGVRQHSINEQYWKDHYAGAGRV